MNYFEALSILNLTENYTPEQLKKAYFKSCLKYHPDKNLDNDTKIQFQNVVKAYEFLSDNDKVEITENYSLSFIINNLLKVFKNENKNENLLNVIVECQKYSYEIFDKLDIDKARTIYLFLTKYGEIFYVNNQMLNKMKNIIDKKNKNNIIIDFKVTLSDLFENNIYKYQYDDNNTFYIPMWFGEMTFETKNDNKNITFNSILDLPDHISIDSYNNISVNIKSNIKELMNKKTIDIKVFDEKVFNISVSLLKIRKYQEIVYYNKGISIPNKKDIYNTNYKGNIIFKITLE